MSKKPIPIVKPNADSRWNQAQQFATGTTEAEASPAPAESSEATAAPAEEGKAAPLRAMKKQGPTVRENFDVDEDLRNEMRLFIAGSRRFRTKRDFLTQCLKDGLKKYKGQ